MSRRRTGKGRAAKPAAESRPAPRGPHPAGPSPRRAAFFALRVLLWLLPVALLWGFASPTYNRFLVVAGENLVHLWESGDVTRLARSDVHHALVQRTDFPVGGDVVGSVRVTDLHFPLILLGALFLAPAAPWRERSSNLGVALVFSAVFHVVLLAFWVEFTYATQLGSWSMEHYGAFARNFWGLGKHLLDLPVKLALPFALWAAFYLRDWLPAPAPRPEESDAPA